MYTQGVRGIFFRLWKKIRKNDFAPSESEGAKSFFLIFFPGKKSNCGRPKTNFGAFEKGKAKKATKKKKIKKKKKKKKIIIIIIIIIIMIIIIMIIIVIKGPMLTLYLSLLPFSIFHLFFFFFQFPFFHFPSFLLHFPLFSLPLFSWYVSRNFPVRSRGATLSLCLLRHCVYTLKFWERHADRMSKTAVWWDGTFPVHKFNLI